VESQDRAGGSAQHIGGDRVWGSHGYHEMLSVDANEPFPAPGFVMYPGNPKLDWGPSTTDVRHLAAINGGWELPYGRKGHSWAQKIFGGWKISAIETL
jgi:hypothetical protein